MPSSETSPSGFDATNRHRTIRLAQWTAAWLAAVALAIFGAEFLWDGNVTLSVLAIALQAAVGAGMILANKRHLLNLDELQQRIQLEAMAITLGVTLIAGIAYSSLDIANVIAGDAEIGNLVLLMGLTYIVALLLVRRRYL
ncbi:MAG: hypothetical protein AAFY69_08150 [Pseudomonadota bacterium]